MYRQRIYPSKVLLFGEYTVLHGSQALAIPFSGKYGKWTRVEQVPEQYSAQFGGYLEWLKSGSQEGLSGILDTDRMEAELHANWTYEANIPEGYGLGSSGALCAAILDRYAVDRGHFGDDQKLRLTLAKLESYFHGKSSGIDPFVSFMARPVLRQRNDSLHLLDPVCWPDGWAVYLVDSGTARVTAEWVGLYQEKYTDPGFRQKVDHSFIPDVEHAIHFLIGQSWDLAWQHIHRISAFQSTFFREMIPVNMQSLWNSCLGSGHSRMKLCGAGGGGYFLLFSQDPGQADILLSGLISTRI